MRSVEELRRESDRNRAELAATVERLKHGISDTTRDLRHMVSLQHVKSEMSVYVRTSVLRWMATEPPGPISLQRPRLLQRALTHRRPQPISRTRISREASLASRNSGSLSAQARLPDASSGAFQSRSSRERRVPSIAMVLRGLSFPFLS